jgi:hypothetical protein
MPHRFGGLGWDVVCLRTCLRREISLVLAMVVMVHIIGTASAGLIAYEGYEYAVGSNIVGEAGGSGWANAWSGSSPSATVGDRDIQSPGATYPGLASAGNKAFISAANQTQRTLATGVLGAGAAEETVWVSFIGRRGGPNNVRFFGLSFYQGTTDSANERFTIGENSNNNNDLWGAHFTSTAQARVEAAGASINTESLLLARIDYHANANDDLHLWVNPDLSLGEPATGTADASSIGLWNLAFDIVSTRAGTTSGGTHGTAFFDEIRTGNRFNDVIPEPASSILALISIAGWALIDGKRRVARELQHHPIGSAQRSAIRKG